MKSIALSVLVVSLASAAQPPGIVNYQGVLRDASNAPLTGSYDMVFRFYSAPTGGEEILVDSHVVSGTGAVTVTGGLFNAGLGAGSLSDGLGSGTYTSLSEVFRDYGDVWLSVTVSGEELSPRVRLDSIPFALNAHVLDGKAASEFGQLSAANTFTTGTQTIQTGAAGIKGLVIQGAAGQSASLEEWQDSTGSTVASVSAGGVFNGNGSGLGSLDAGSLASGTIPDGRIAGTYSGAVTLSNAANSFTGDGEAGTGTIRVLLMPR